MIRIAIAIAAVACVLLGAATPARGDKLADIRARGTLIVSVKNDAQHAHKDPAHFDKRGFEVELVHLFAKKIVGDASKVDLRILSRPVRLPMLVAGSVDLVVSMIPVTPENSTQVDFSHPYFAQGLSLLVRAGKGAQLVCASDACYTRENMDRDVLPKILWDAAVMRDSLATLRTLRDRAGATMMYGHDPEQWEAIPRAPAAVL